MDTDDWFTQLSATTDRLREAAETPTPTPNLPPKTVKRPPVAPRSGASERSVKARNAYMRVSNKQGGRTP